MATINATNAAPNQPRIDVTASVDRFQTYVSSATLSAGDVIKMNSLKLPLGAEIVEVRVLGKTVDGSSIFQIGTDYTGQGAALGSATVAVAQALVAPITGIPYRVSVSDDFQPRYVTMTLTQNGAAVSGTASLSVTLFVRYTMDP